MISSRKGEFHMQNQALFKYASTTKAWLCATFFSSIIFIYLSLNGMAFWITPSLGNLITVKGIFQLILSKLGFRNSSSLISGIVLMYYGRWVERRYGSSKFVNFILLNFIQSALIEIAVYMILSQFHGYIPSAMYFATGPYALLTALYLTYVKEIPVMPYSSILGISLSVHSLPFIMFVQLVEFSKATLIACGTGALSVLLYRHFSKRLNLLPHFFIQLFRSTSNPIGWLAQKFAEFGEFEREGSALPVAATIERQRVELVDNYERRLMFGQMQQIHRNERGLPIEGQLRYLNRLLGRISLGNTLPNEDQIRQLVDMGLGTRQAVREALLQCGNDASEAANMLLHNRR